METFVFGGLPGSAELAMNEQDNNITRKQFMPKFQLAMNF
jgi:hypothetical protein